MKIIAPRVHLNGDTKDTLQNAVIEAAHSVSAAIGKLQEATPNARNYYIISDRAFERARTEHGDRMKRLQSVYDELAALYEAIDDGKTEVEVA